MWQPDGGGKVSKLTAMKAAVLLLFAGFASSAIAAEMALAIPKGGRIGIIDLVRPEVAHFHVGATEVKSFLRTYSAPWSVAEVIDDPLIQSLTSTGLKPVTLYPTERLTREKQSWIVSKPTADGLARGCMKELERVIEDNRLSALIIVAPGQNVSPEDVDGDRLQKIPDYVRGWGFSTSDDDQGRTKPVVFNLTQLLLIIKTTDGIRLEHREWGGTHEYDWPDFVPAANFKAMSSADIAKLRPVIAEVMKRQIARFVPYLRP
jgi:hypothetical protein